MNETNGRKSLLFTLRTSAFTVSAKEVEMRAVLKDRDDLFIYEGDRRGNGNLRKLSDPPEKRKNLDICGLSDFFDVLYVCLQYKAPELADVSTESSFTEV